MTDANNYLSPIKTEGGVYSDDPTFQKIIEERDTLKAEILRLRAEVATLREALKPFADDAEEYWSDVEYKPDGSAVGVDVADLRAAAAALKEMGE